jgi:stringent starvation protein B
MNAPEPTTTRPYLIRALHEWCTDNGFTPYVAVRVDNSVQVPREYVNDGEIVLNVGFDATSSLQLGNDYIEFKARFGGKSRDILVPVGRVVAIYARENGQGMAFPPPVDLLPDALSTSLEEVETVSPEDSAPDVARVVQLVATDSVSEDGDKPRPPTTPGASRPALKLVK